jgi:hypothetical protein
MNPAFRNAPWRLWLYEALTQAILGLAWVRDRFCGDESPRMGFSYPPGRVFHIFQTDHLVCCDCGLGHVLRFEGAVGECGHEHEPGQEVVGHCWPRRPVGYGYKLRLGAGTPALVKDRSPA